MDAVPGLFQFRCHRCGGLLFRYAMTGITPETIIEIKCPHRVTGGRCRAINLLTGPAIGVTQAGTPNPETWPTWTREAVTP